MTSKITITVKCPECGAPIRHPEGVYTFKCTFCASVLRTETGDTSLKYIIPSRIKEEELPVLIQKELHAKIQPSIELIHTVYKPFWYFKGMIYSCFIARGNNEINAKTYYYTFQADPDYLSSLYSLGLRAEVLDLEPYDSEFYKDNGILLPIILDKNDAQEKAMKIAGKAIKFANKKLQIAAAQALYNTTEFIGERFFIIYYPIVNVYCTCGGYFTFMIDGVNGNLLEKKKETHIPSPPAKDESPPYHIRILTHRCKNCGYDLQPKDFDIVFFCTTCSMLWLLEGNDYYPLEIKVIETDREQNIVYLPFWKFEATFVSKSATISIKTVGDLSGFIKMGQFFLRNQEHSRNATYYIPAIVARNAKAVIKLASRISRSQNVYPVSSSIEKFHKVKILNASLPESEAEEMLRVLIFSLIGRQDARAINFYSDYTTEVHSTELIWYPFEEKRNMLVDKYHNYSFPAQSMDLDVF